MTKWHAHVTHMGKHMNTVGGPGPLPPINPALQLWSWISLLGNDWKSSIASTSGKDGIFAEFTALDFTTKCAAVNLAKPWMSSQFSSE